MPSARVTITSRQTNVSQTAQTNDSGEYQFNNLLAGDYTVTVEAANLKTTTLIPAINNFDFSLFKNFYLGGESRRRIQLRADFFNAFNHPQYIPGSPNDVSPIPTTGVGQVNTIFAGNTDFNRPERVFSSNPRVIQMALRFDFWDPAGLGTF
ncbi:MAG TPA: carboxypeptidase-like regulatory domain-containing protein [Pyrinomonadaceae bacterium]